MKDKKLEQYKKAIIENFPDLAISSIEYLSEGWDSVACRVNGMLIFRFPKRQEVADALQVEINLLPELARRLPAPIPDFQYIGKGGKHFPYRFVGYRALEGTLYDDWGETCWDESWWRQELGEFLTELHLFPVERARELGVRDCIISDLNEPGATWRETVGNYYDLVRAQVFPVLDAEQQNRTVQLFEGFLGDRNNFAFHSVLLHADIWDEHIILNLATRKISGIIDFGDVCIGDPALDVATGVRPFYRNDLSENYLQRRNFFAQIQPLNSILFGLAKTDPSLVEYGRYTLNDERPRYL
jgi:aminoglycoside 2''-phosphotransferase